MTANARGEAAAGGQGRAPAPVAGEEARGGGVLAVARDDVVLLALLALAHVAALGVIAALVIGHVSLIRRTSDLQVRLRGVSDVDGRLALLERQIAIQGADVVAAKARVSPDVRPSAISDRVEFKAKELNVALSGDVVSEGTTSLTVSLTERVELRRFDRSVDARGAFKDLASLVAEIESWSELVSIRTLSLRRSGKGGETLGHFEVSVYQAQPEPAGPGGRP